MYAAPTIFSRIVHYVDVSDVDFFKSALAIACDRFKSGQVSERSDIKQVKQNTPVVFASQLSKPTPEEKITITRKEVNGERARRKFLMIDADFDPGDEKDSEETRQKMIDLAASLNTPILIYPTVSFPDKPRFRAVMFSRRALSSDQYYQAMSWWYDQLGAEPFDDSDTRMSANRNAPMFVSEEQVNNVYSTLDDESLELLDTKLWNSYPKPKKKEKIDYSSLHESDAGLAGVKFDSKKLVKATLDIGQTPLGESRNKCWKFIESVASAVLSGKVSRDTADKMMEALADRAENEPKKREWTEGNIAMLESSMKKLNDDKDAWKYVKPLTAYSEILFVADFV